MPHNPCPPCGGALVRPESLAVPGDGGNRAAVTRLSTDGSLAQLERLQARAGALVARPRTRADHRCTVVPPRPAAPPHRARLGLTSFKALGECSRCASRSPSG